MDNYLQTTEGTTLDGEFTGFDEAQQTQIIKTTMLDGSASIQVVGNPATVLTIGFCCEKAVRRQIETIAGTGDSIIVAWDDRIYTGVIDDKGVKVDHMGWAGTEECSFSVLANEVTAR